MKFGTLEVTYCKYNNLMAKADLNKFRKCLKALMVGYTAMCVSANLSSMVVTEVFADIEGGNMANAISIRDGMFNFLGNHLSSFGAIIIMISVIATILHRISKGEENFKGFLSESKGVALTVLLSFLSFLATYIFLVR